MTKRELPRPTNAELAILQILWECGPSTVREVQQALDNDSGYTTVLKLMQIMAEKGLVVRDERSRVHIYKAARSAEETQRHLVRDLLDRVFGGSMQRLVLQALSSKKASKAELLEIRHLLDQLEKDSKARDK